MLISTGIISIIVFLNLLFPPIRQIGGFNINITSFVNLKNF
nr:MAG TPA: hypothetical protein [Caudoviricetes sp.]